TDPLKYKLSFTFPTDMTGYSSVEVRDVMPAGLSLASTPPDNVVVKIGSTQVYSGAQSGTVASYTFDSKDIDLTTLAGKSVDMYVTASITKAGSPLAYPTTITNTGQLVINNNPGPGGPGPVDTDGPDVTNTGRIYGTLYNDANYNGVMDAGEAGIPGQLVKLSDGQSTTTDAGGNYYFDVAEGTYTVTFPSLANGMGRTSAPTTGTVPNVVIAMGDSATQAKRLDSGYGTPASIEDLKDSFSKTVDDGTGAYVSAVTVTDARTPLNYKLSFTFPADMAGYASVEVKDVMNAGLELDDSRNPDVVVKLGGTILSSTRQSGTEASYVFDGATTDLFALAGKTVDMYINARLAKVNGEYLTDITNTGRLVVNDNPGPGGRLGPADTDGPAVTDACVIKGTLFNDLNDNGIIDADETGRYAGKTVKLFVVTSTASAPAPALAVIQVAALPASASAAQVATTQTDADGNYSFQEAPGTYFVVFPDLKPLVFTNNSLGQSVNILVSYESLKSQIQVVDQGYRMPAAPATTPVTPPATKRTGGAVMSSPGSAATRAATRTSGLPKTGDVLRALIPLAGLAIALFLIWLLVWRKRTDKKDEEGQVNPV
ncbi:MAG: isopeptide-forming domain-containing fimbrial protein, partial [Coriobacteriia bacterium]|nr:isopeptide-forming domain-containing fimbrial protein [Coriobacteriia bacterium]